MKRNAKSLLAFICMGLLCMACGSDGSDEILPTTDPEVEVIENPYAMEEENVIRGGKSFLKELPDRGRASLRSAAVENLTAEITACDFMVTVAGESMKRTRNVAQKIPVYTINYKDGAGKEVGVVMTIGDERIPDKDKVIMYGTGGELNGDWTTKENAGFFKDRIAGYIHHLINYPAGEEEDTQLRYAPNMSHTFYEIPMECDWYQERDPYNRYAQGFNGRRSYAGCVAVAMAMIMAHHNWPSSGSFPRYTDVNMDTPVNVSVSYSLSSADYQRLIYARDVSGIPANFQPSYERVKEYIANRIAECGYHVSMIYGLSGSYSYDGLVPDAFKKMRYTCDGLKAYDLNKIKTDLQNQRPVYMAATNPESGGRHAFVIKGVIETPEGEHYIALAIDDPWYTDGYVFNSKIFTDPNYKAKGPGDIVYTYRSNCQTICNIRPNK